METQHQTHRPAEVPAPSNPRERLLAGIAVRERRLDAAGISTAFVEGGAGRSIVLLHGPGEHAAKWFRVLPDLIRTHHVVAPDLPGHGASDGGKAPLDADRVIEWLYEFIDQTCPHPPLLIGQIVGGAIAARFAAEHSGRISGLVLADSLGLVPFQPTQEFHAALMEFVTAPDPVTHDRLWARCAFDLDRLRNGMGERWAALKEYNVERAGTPALQSAQQALMQHFGMPAIDSRELERISVPTTLIWGRHDLATNIAVAEEASARYGWPLQVIEGAADDPAIEQPEEFLRAVRLVMPDDAKRLRQ